MPIIEGWFFVLLIKPFYSFMCPNFCSYVFRLTTYLVFMPIRTFRLLLVLKCGMKSLVIPFIRYNILFHSEHHYTRLAYLVFIGVWTYYSDFLFTMEVHTEQIWPYIYSRSWNSRTLGRFSWTLWTRLTATRREEHQSASSGSIIRLIMFKFYPDTHTHIYIHTHIALPFGWIFDI